MTAPTLRTPRLVLRPWQPSDREPFAELNRDPQVVEFLGGPLTREQSDALADRIEADFERRAFGFWAVEIPGVTRFAGLTGLSIPRFEAPLMSAVEVGWRLAPGCWGHGYATEGAIASLVYGFAEVGLDQIVAFTAEHNVRSRRVMERLGMTHDPADDFEHPLVTLGELRRHVLYRARRAEWTSPQPGVLVAIETSLSAPKETGPGSSVGEAEA
jgi:ribosomal-protein-alanine N-acetyltransferase